LGFEFDYQIDGRSLRAGEKDRMFGLLRTKKFGSDLEEAEVKCAVAVVAFKLGLLEVVEILREQLQKENMLTYFIYMGYQSRPGQLST